MDCNTSKGTEVIEGEQDVWAIDMNSPVLLIWTFLSILVSALGTYSFIQPIWIVTPNQTGSFGLISTCVTVLDVVSQDFGKQRCEFYGGYFNLGSLPSGAWQASCTLFGGGCILLCCGAFLAVCTSCIPNDAVKSVTVMAGYVQFIAVLVMIAGLFIYPLGFNSKFIRKHCGGGSSMYNSDQCEVGWGLILAVVGTALAMFCPVLSHYTDMQTTDLL